MKKPLLYAFEVDLSSGIYKVEVYAFEYHPPQSVNPHLCDSDLDFYGWTEMDYAISSPETGTVFPVTSFCQGEIDYIEGRICAAFLD